MEDESLCFKIKSEDDALHVNKLIAELGISPIVTVKNEQYFELLDPNMEICIPITYITNPGLDKFKKITVTSLLPLVNLDKILKIKRSVLEKLNMISCIINKASDLQKLGYLPGVNVHINHNFKLNVDLAGMKFGYIDLRIRNRSLIAKFCECEIDEIEILIEDIDIIPIDAKIKRVSIPDSNIYKYTDTITHDAQNLAQNQNIKEISTAYDISGDFENNYTLLDYNGNSEYISKIIERNRKYLHDSRFTKVKPVMP